MIHTVSVVIPNYNGGKYIKDAIESVLNQTYPIKEIIIVDDCSSDNSKIIIKSYASKYRNIKAIFLKENRGVSHARNIGIAQVTTDYFSYLDSDDYFSPNKIENEMNLINQNSSCKKEIIAFSPVIYVDENGNSIREQGCNHKDFSTGNIYLKLVAGYNLSRGPRDCCMSKKLFDEIGGYDESNNFYEDYDLIIRCAKKAIFLCTYQYGTHYRQKENGLSSKPHQVHVITKKKIRNKYFTKLQFKDKCICNYYRLKRFIKEDMLLYIKRMIPTKMKKYIKKNLESLGSREERDSSCLP